LKATITPSLSRAKIRADRDGVSILTGTIEKGQGAETVFCQIVSEALGVPLERIRVEPFDSEVAPYDQVTGSSRSTFSMGTALLRAAEDLQTRLRALAGDVLGVPPHHVALESGGIVDTAHPERRVSWDALLERAGADGMYGEGASDSSQLTLPGPGRIASAFWMVAAGGAEVEVDRETGVVSVVRYVTAADAGKAINPIACKGQLEGSVMMGLGPTLVEQMLWEDGILMTDGLLTYTLPTMPHLPDLQVAVEELPDPNGPYGAKGIGEVAIVPVAPAIANAVRACSGIRPHALPMTPEQMWRLFRSRMHADATPNPGRRG
jgi:carbon-monoxide dehydrogenase large subunit